MQENNMRCFCEHTVDAILDAYTRLVTAAIGSIIKADSDWTMITLYSCRLLIN